MALAETSPMVMPRGKITGQWLDSRSELDQTQILKMATKYFTNEERALLEQLLGTTALRFDAEEAQILKRRGVGAVLTGVTKSPNQAPGPPLLQFYDFCMTIDQIKNIMRGLYVHLQNPGIKHDMLRQLETIILYPDFVPYEIRAKVLEDEKQNVVPADRRAMASAAADAFVPGQAGMLKTDAYKREYYGVGMPKMVLWSADGTIDNAVLADKNSEGYKYARCWDEAYFLRSPLHNALLALNEGLFMIFECTEAPYITLPATAEELANKEILDEKNRDVWEPRWQTSHYVDEGSAAFIPRQSWINSFKYDYGDDGKAMFYRTTNLKHIDLEQITILQAKHVDLTNYPSVMAYTGNLTMKAPGDVGGALLVPYFARKFYNSATDLVEKIAFTGADRNEVYTRQEPVGGAIGKYMFWIDYSHGGMHTADNMLKRQIFPEPTGGDPYILHVDELTLDKMNAQMRRLSNHPIHACPRLAAAYRDSGMFRYMFEMMTYVQRALEAAAYTLRGQMGDSNKMSSVENWANIEGSSVVPRCAKGMVPRYYDANTNTVIPEEEAFVVRDGKLELASHVSRVKYDCVGRVSLGDVKARNSDEAFKFYPVITGKNSTPAGLNYVPEHKSPAVIRQMVDRVGGFQMSSQPVNSIYNSSDAMVMDAYVVKKSDL